MFKLLLMSAIALMLSGCGGDEVSWATQEDMRAIAKNNASYNAKEWRKGAGEYAGWHLDIQGDSTISHKCAAGDGWASVEAIHPENSNRKIKLKCHTVSKEIGCIPKEKFVKKSFASEDGQCNHNLPVPLPKIVN